MPRPRPLAAHYPPSVLEGPCGASRARMRRTWSRWRQRMDGRMAGCPSVPLAEGRIRSNALRHPGGESGLTAGARFQTARVPDRAGWPRLTAGRMGTPGVPSASRQPAAGRGPDSPSGAKAGGSRIRRAKTPRNHHQHFRVRNGEKSASSKSGDNPLEWRTFESAFDPRFYWG